MQYRLLALLLSSFSLPIFGASVTISGGIKTNAEVQPLVFTWTAPVPVSGAGWTAGESITLTLHGPLNSPGVAAADLVLGTATADSQGNFNAAPAIPYDSGITGLTARIPRPGLYQVQATGASSGAVPAGDFVNLCPATYPGDVPFDWGKERGGRDGVLPGPLQAYSPERFDPEWLTVWDERPVELYATVAPLEDPEEQPALVSHTDNPVTHSGHDSNSFLIPDPGYRWLIGTANYYSDDEEANENGRLEVEWETQNNGTPATYGQGNIGLPLWAKPSSGDRVYMVGRWILDAGHPELGDRTEIHPPRLVASMRKRPATSAAGAAAAQVDIYVSGHGGGANRMPPGLSATLNQGGYGGGRIRDVLNPDDQMRYYRAGPLSGLLAILVIPLIEDLAGVPLSDQIYAQAGPSAFPWGGAGAEFRPVNDMDYDFDVPLPAPPSGATAVVMETADHPLHSTSVAEVVTYTNPVNGLPTVAHIHLPYNSADNGIYARTLKFSWDTATRPDKHFQVTLNNINVLGTAGKWQMFADVGGQWSYLSGQAPALLSTRAGQNVPLAGTPIDVWVGADDALRVYVQGYRDNCLDDSFGKLFGMAPYNAGVSFLSRCGPVDNDDLGGALLEIPPDATPAGNYTIPARDPNGGRNFSVVIMVTPIP
jgi:hypothetical protein